MVGNKILVIGCCGSGKSYLARQLRDYTNLPLYYIDCIFWKENWTHLSKDELKEEINKITSTDKWIIDGNYSSSLEDRFIKADTIFFMDISEEECIKAEANRRGKPREDLPSFLKEEYDPSFIDFIKSFKSNKRSIIMNLMKKYNDKNYYIFKSREEKDIFLNEYFAHK